MAMTKVRMRTEKRRTQVTLHETSKQNLKARRETQCRHGEAVMIYTARVSQKKGYPGGSKWFRGCFFLFVCSFPPSLKENNSAFRTELCYSGTKITENGEWWMAKGQRSESATWRLEVLRPPFTQFELLIITKAYAWHRTEPRHGAADRRHARRGPRKASHRWFLCVFLEHAQDGRGPV